MAFVEYILLAVLGSTGAAASGAPSSPSIRTLDADAIAQPSGGAAGECYVNAGIALQATGGSTDKGAGTGRKGRHPQSARRSHRAHRRHHRTSHTSGNRQH
jgi:hypothetical protein